MTNFESDNGTTRDDLLQRVALMETMIAEGRRSTARFGWIFVLWGLVDLSGVGWQVLRPSYWVWPVTISSGMILQFAGIALRRKSGNWGDSTTVKSRSISAVWGMMGLAISLYCFTAMFTRQPFGATYIAAIFMFVGLAHATSSIILRWGVQGFVAGVWWAGGMACFFVPRANDLLLIFCAEMLFGMVFFGLYAMWLERRRAAGLVEHHA